MAIPINPAQDLIQRHAAISPRADENGFVFMAWLYSFPPDAGNENFIVNHKLVLKFFPFLFPSYFAVSELDLLNLARSTTEHEVSWLAQMITINFAMIVAIYYFLHGAKLALKAFTFFAYTVGMLVLLGEMLVEANIKEGVMEALRALPIAQLSRPTVRYLAVYDSWIAVTTRITFNLAVWLFWFAILYLLFFWKRNSTKLTTES